MRDAMTRFPQIRRWMIASAIIAPCLIFAGCLLFVWGSFGWGFCAFFIGMMIAVIFPAGIAYPCGDTDRAATTDSAPVTKWARRIAMLVLWFWLIRQPEFRSLFERISEEGALWNRWIIAPLAIYT